MKVNLEIKRPKHNAELSSRGVPLTKLIPFWKSNQGTYVHRVRYGNVYYRNNKAHHAAPTMWCGQTGFINSGELLEFPSTHATFCATCEGRAIGSGQHGAPIICGRIVKFSPRI